MQKNVFQKFLNLNRIRKLYNVHLFLFSMKKENVQKWLGNLARDFVALGSPVFLVLVALRLWLIPNYEIITGLSLSFVIFMISFVFVKQNIYSGIGLITLVFLIQNYADFRFNVFAIITYVLLIGSLFYLKKDWKKILLGVLIGGLSAGIGYYFIPKIFSF